MRSMNGKTIRALRHRLGWSQSDLARALSVAEITVRRWEADDHRPFPRHEAQLVRLLQRTEHGRDSEDRVEGCR